GMARASCLQATQFHKVICSVLLAAGDSKQKKKGVGKIPIPGRGLVALCTPTCTKGAGFPCRGLECPDTLSGKGEGKRSTKREWGRKKSTTEKECVGDIHAKTGKTPKL